MKGNRSFIFRLTAILLTCIMGCSVFFCADTMTVRADDGIADTADAVQVPTGKQTKGGKTYYYDAAGNPVRNKWVKISHKWYFFGGDGAMYVNRIAGNKATGYYYVDNSGIRISTKEMNLAVKFVLAHSSAKSSNKKRLKKCFKYYHKHYPYKRFYDKPKASKMPSYARYALGKKKANCYRYAAGFAYIARVLGYDVRVGIGKVSSNAVGGLSPHGWTEVKVGKTWYLCDASMQNARRGLNCYMRTRKKYPYRLKKKKAYKMTVANGTVRWK